MQKPRFVSSNRLPSRWVSHAARQALCFALLLALPGGAQNGPGSPSHGQFAQPKGQRTVDSASGIVEPDSLEEETRLRALNVERQKSMVSDTNKLLTLAAELNAEVSSANPDSLTPAQLRKVAAIEKLAHSVKEKMSAAVRGTPVYRQPLPPPFR